MRDSRIPAPTASAPPRRRRGAAGVSGMSAFSNAAAGYAILRRMETQACSQCGKAISGSDILYTPDARIVCSACSAVAEVQRDEGRAANNIKTAAWSCLGAAVLAWFFNPFFIVNVGAILSGI